jgi:hypothetical protein
VHLKTFGRRLLLLLHKLPRFLPTSKENLKRIPSILKNAHQSRCSSLPRVIVQQNVSMYISVLAVVHPYHAYESGMQTHGDRLQQAAIVDCSALQRAAADRDLLDLYYRYAQGEGRWYMDVGLWVHRAASPHPSRTVADPSLGVPMLCFAGKEQTNSNTFKRMFVSKDMQQYMADGWPAVGPPVSKGPFSFDCRSDVWRSLPQGTEESQQEVSVPRTPKACGLMIAGHDHLERSILRRKVGTKGIVLPPQRAHHLAHNRVVHPKQESDTSAVFERLGERHERSKQSCAKVLRPAAARLICLAPAVTRSTSPSTQDDVGRVEGHALPTLAELLNPQHQQPPDEILHSHSNAFIWQCGDCRHFSSKWQCSRIEPCWAFAWHHACAPSACWLRPVALLCTETGSVLAQDYSMNLCMQTDQPVSNCVRLPAYGTRTVQRSSTGM